MTQNRFQIELRGSSYAFTACLVLFLMLSQSEANAQQPFKSPEEASAALIKAVKAGDTKSALTILGPGSNDILSSGDAVADQQARDIVVQGYEQKNRIEKSGAKATLFIGDLDWPFPIPLIEQNGMWRFNTAEGRQEILYRRIGRNELTAIQVALAYVDAQYDYAEEDRGFGPNIYAQRFFSSPGKRDGLYWPTKENEQPSPIGEFVVGATEDGYKVGGARQPYVGYYYKILTAQGPNASGGSANYVVGGKMIGGFALVAWPATYGNSGVMTFVVNHDGIVFQKDLGEGTVALAGNMRVFNPDHTWKKVPTEDLQILNP